MTKELPYKRYTGTGNSLAKIPKRDQIYWNNEPIDEHTIVQFLKLITVECKVTLSNRKTRRTWGTCWPPEKRMTLYRHSVWVFLHELAHIFTSKAERRFYGPHGRPFIESLELLFYYWQDSVNGEIDET